MTRFKLPINVAAVLIALVIVFTGSLPVIINHYQDCDWTWLHGKSPFTISSDAESLSCNLFAPQLMLLLIPGTILVVIPLAIFFDALGLSGDQYILYLIFSLIMAFNLLIYWCVFKATLSLIKKKDKSNKLKFTKYIH